MFLILTLVTVQQHTRVSQLAVVRVSQSSGLVGVLHNDRRARSLECILEYDLDQLRVRIEHTVKPLSRGARGNRHSRRGGEDPREDETTSELHRDTEIQESERARERVPMVEIIKESELDVYRISFWAKSGPCRLTSSRRPCARIGFAHHRGLSNDGHCLSLFYRGFTQIHG